MDFVLKNVDTAGAYPKFDRCQLQRYVLMSCLVLIFDKLFLIKYIDKRVWARYTKFNN